MLTMTISTSEVLAEYDDYFHINITAILHAFTIGYEKDVRPNYGGDPVTVGVSMYILSVNELSDRNSEFTFDMYFRQFWTDPRLAFARRPGFNKVVVSASDYVDKIWTPDTFFVNSKQMQVHNLPSKNSFLRIMHTGEILLSSRMTVTASCPLDLSWFPMDSQLCSLEIESFGFTMSDVKFRWNEGNHSVVLSPDVSLPEFNVLGHRQRTIEASLSSGNYSRLLADLAFKRAIGSYKVQVFFPNLVMVLLAGLSLWLPRQAGTARILLGILPVLTAVTLMFLINQQLARVSYFKCMDIFLLWCILMGTFVLVEFTLVAFVADVVGEDQKQNSQGNQQSTDENGMDGSKRAGRVNAMPNRREFIFKSVWVDYLSRAVYPIIFSLFNIVFWNKCGSRNEEITDLIHM